MLRMTSARERASDAFGENLQSSSVYCFEFLRTWCCILLSLYVVVMKRKAVLFFSLVLLVLLWFILVAFAAAVVRTMCPAIKESLTVAMLVKIRVRF